MAKDGKIVWSKINLTGFNMDMSGSEVKQLLLNNHSSDREMYDLIDETKSGYLRDYARAIFNRPVGATLTSTPRVHWGQLNLSGIDRNENSVQNKAALLRDNADSIYFDLLKDMDADYIRRALGKFNGWRRKPAASTVAKKAKPTPSPMTFGGSAPVSAEYVTFEVNGVTINCKPGSKVKCI